METFIKSFLEYLKNEKKYTRNTLASYEGDLYQLSSFIKSLNVNTDFESINRLLNNEVLSRYMQKLREKNYSISTLARKIASVKSFIKYLINTGKVKADQVPNLNSPQVSKSITKPLSVAEVRQLLAEPAKIQTIESKRDRAMLELLYATGMRASELMSLNLADIDFDSNTINCKKNANISRSIAMDKIVSNILKEYINEARVKLVNNPNEVALFLNRRGDRLTRQGFWQIIHGYAEKAGLDKKVTPRSLRSSFAVHRLKGGADLEMMKEIMGHAHISTTKAYQDARISEQ